jgi:hypothetical protein
MTKREKILIVVVVLSWLIIGGYYYTVKGDWDAAQEENKELRDNLKDLEEKKVLLDEQIETLRYNKNVLLEEKKKADDIIVDLRKRKRPIHITKDMSDPCKTCASNNKISVKVEDNQHLVRMTVHDVFQPEEGGELEFLPEFDRQILQPYEKALDNCSGKLEECLTNLDRATDNRVGSEPEKPISFIKQTSVAVGAGLIPTGDLGYTGRFSYRAIRLGHSKSFNLTAGPDVSGNANFDGTNISGSAALVLEATW